MFTDDIRMHTRNEENLVTMEFVFSEEVFVLYYDKLDNSRVLNLHEECFAFSK